MKLITALTLVCAALILAGCRTYHGGTADEYDSTYYHDTSTPPVSSPKGTPMLPPGGTPRESIPKITPP